MTLALAAVLVLAGGLAAQPSGTAKVLKWQAYVQKNELSIAFPEGSKAFSEDNEVFLGKSRSRVSKRVFVYRTVNGAVVMLEAIEGDLKSVKDELIGRMTAGASGYSLVKSSSYGPVSVELYAAKQGKLQNMQQFVLFKKRLYVIHGYSADANSDLVARFFQSLTINYDDKAAMPNLLANDDPKAAQNPPDISVSETDPADPNRIEDKPDRGPIFLYKPRPRYSDVNRRAGVQGDIVIRALFGADGSVLKTEFVSGQPAFLEGARAAARGVIFVPAEKDGLPVSVWKSLSYSHAIY